MSHALVSDYFLSAFSIIFDKKYGIDSDLREFINENFAGKSFVKVVLWQDDENSPSDVKWVRKSFKSRFFFINE